jgi:hypothetical protein
MWFVGLVVPVQTIFVLPRRPITKKFFIVHYLNFFVPIAQQAGQAGLKKLKRWLFGPKSWLFGPT